MSGVSITLALSGAMLLSTSVQAAGATGNIGIEGVNNHDWRDRLGLVEEIVAKDGSFDVDVFIAPQAADDRAWQTWRPDLSKLDVLLSGYNNLGGKPQWPEEKET